MTIWYFFQSAFFPYIFVKICCFQGVRFRVMVFYATFNNISDISWRSVLLMEKTRVSRVRENHWPVTCFQFLCQTLHTDKQSTILFHVYIGFTIIEYYLGNNGIVFEVLPQ